MYKQAWAELGQAQPKFESGTELQLYFTKLELEVGSLNSKFGVEV